MRKRWAHGWFDIAAQIIPFDDGLSGGREIVEVAHVADCAAGNH
jgi:hypothetical protein